jgi:Na+/melibiose symporter-like transporter
MKRLRWYDFITLNIFWLGLNFRNNAIGAIFLPYLVVRFVDAGIRNTALGGLRTAGLVIAMLVQPAFGLLSDRSTSRFGRRRPFLLLGVILDLVLLAWMASAGGYWSLLAVVMLIQISSNISHGPLQALIPDLVPEDQRGRASAVKAIFELLPVVLIGVTIAPLVGIGRFDWAVVATGGVLFFMLVVMLVSVRETPLKDLTRSSRLSEPLIPALLRVSGMLAGIALGAVIGLVNGAMLGGIAALAAWLTGFKDYVFPAFLAVGGITMMAVAVVGGVSVGVRATLGKLPTGQQGFLWWVVNRLMFLAAITSIQGFAPYFLMYSFGVNAQQAAAMTGQLMAVVGIFTLLSALPSGWLADKVGQQQLLQFSGILAAVGTAVLLSCVWLSNLMLIYLAGIILGVATGFFVTVNWALGTQLAPAAEAGRYLGVSNLAGAGAGMIGSGIGGPLADMLNASQPGLGYFVIFTGYLILFLLSVFSLRGIKHAS